MTLELNCDLSVEISGEVFNESFLSFSIFVCSLIRKTEIFIKK